MQRGTGEDRSVHEKGPYPGRRLLNDGFQREARHESRHRFRARQQRQAVGPERLAESLQTLPKGCVVSVGSKGHPDVHQIISGLIGAVVVRVLGHESTGIQLLSPMRAHESIPEGLCLLLSVSVSRIHNGEALGRGGAWPVKREQRADDRVEAVNEDVRGPFHVPRQLLVPFDEVIPEIRDKGLAGQFVNPGLVFRIEQHRGEGIPRGHPGRAVGENVFPRLHDW